MENFKEFYNDAEEAYRPFKNSSIQLDPETEKPTKDEISRLHKIFDPIGKKYNKKVHIHYDKTFGLTIVPVDISSK